MRGIVWLLILINLGLFSYFNADDLFGTHPIANVKAISPEKIVLLSESDILKLPKKSADVPNPLTVETACFEWGIFSANSLKAAQTELSDLAILNQTKSKNAQEALRYWVYIPSLKSTAEAEAKVAKLNAQGITDVFIVQEPKWKNAISLGVFSDEKLATNHLEDLKAKGVTNVIERLRNEKSGGVSLVTVAITPDQLSKLNALKPDFPGSEINETGCKAL